MSTWNEGNFPNPSDKWTLSQHSEYCTRTPKNGGNSTEIRVKTVKWSIISKKPQAFDTIIIYLLFSPSLGRRSCLTFILIPVHKYLLIYTHPYKLLISVLCKTPQILQRQICCGDATILHRTISRVRFFFFKTTIKNFSIFLRTTHWVQHVSNSTFSGIIVILLYFICSKHPIKVKIVSSFTSLNHSANFNELIYIPQSLSDLH